MLQFEGLILFGFPGLLSPKEKLAPFFKEQHFFFLLQLDGKQGKLGPQFFVFLYSLILDPELPIESLLHFLPHFHQYLAQVVCSFSSNNAPKLLVLSSLLETVDQGPRESGHQFSAQFFAAFELIPDQSLHDPQSFAIPIKRINDAHRDFLEFLIRLHLTQLLPHSRIIRPRRLIRHRN